MSALTDTLERLLGEARTGNLVSIVFACAYDDDNHTHGHSIGDTDPALLIGALRLAEADLVNLAHEEAEEDAGLAS
jgi:hypothetical protein